MHSKQSLRASHSMSPISGQHPFRIKASKVTLILGRSKLALPESLSLCQIRFRVVLLQQRGFRQQTPQLLEKMNLYLQRIEGYKPS